MIIKDFKSFLSSVIVEELHPELKSIVTSVNPSVKKQTLLTKKIKDLSSRGESTGIEGNMPKGSSRAYMKHEEDHHIELDGKPTTIKTGIKVAIRANLDKHHRGELRLGAMQNKAENEDHWVNSNYRILRHEERNKFSSNKEGGIFPPLIDHDSEHHEWSHVGHVNNVSHSQFKKLTKTKDFPNGISHDDFVGALVRFDRKNNGRHWVGYGHEEQHLDRVEQHPLVQKFIDYHGNTGTPPDDYGQIKNMGVFHHLDGSKHIVARDHGFSNEVQEAYTNARRVR